MNSRRMCRLRMNTSKMRTDYLLELEAKLDARMGMLSSESARDKQEKERLGKLFIIITELFIESLNRTVILRFLR